jgi:glycosyltransferase involved in cell wall biosynthesis
MKKQRIVFASVLNPVNDTRMFEKMGVSLAGQNDYEIFIIGQPVSHIPVHAGIHFLPCKKVKRLSISRLFLPLQIALKLIKVKPNLLIVNTHELLIVSVANRIIFGCKIVYDLRENYYRNIRFAEGFPFWLRTPLALYVRLKEKIAAPLFHHFILAEKAYQSEVNFIGNCFTVLENKAALSVPVIRVKNPVPSRLLFSGTIAHSTGVFEAIALASSLHNIIPEIGLTIVGYCALQDIREEILNMLKDKPFINLIGFDHPVPHPIIMEEISKADFGIIYYPP